MLSEIQRLWKQSGYLAHFRILWVSTTWTLSESHRLYIFFPNVYGSVSISRHWKTWLSFFQAFKNELVSSFPASGLFRE